MQHKVCHIAFSKTCGGDQILPVGEVGWDLTEGFIGTLQRVPLGPYRGFHWDLDLTEGFIGTSQRVSLRPYRGFYWDLTEGFIGT